MLQISGKHVPRQNRSIGPSRKTDDFQTGKKRSTRLRTKVSENREISYKEKLMIFRQEKKVRPASGLKCLKIVKLIVKKSWCPENGFWTSWNLSWRKSHDFQTRKKNQPASGRRCLKIVIFIKIFFLMIFRQKRKTLTRLRTKVSENRATCFEEKLMIFRQRKNVDPPLD